MTLSKGKRLRRLIEKESIIAVPGAFSGILAKLVEDTGFKAVYISGAGLANGIAALPDIGLLTMTEVLILSGYITKAVDIPCIVDVDTGFGEPLNVVRLMQGLEQIGAAGMHIEDQVFPKKCGHLSGKKLVHEAEMMEKISAAVEARIDPGFIVIARTDAREKEGIKGAIKRANLYIEAGADMIFPEALYTKEEFRIFAKEVRCPLLANMTEFGKSPYLSVDEFEDMGYSIVIFPLTIMRLLLKSVKCALDRLKTEGTQKGLIEDMLTRKEIYKLIGYEDYDLLDKRLEEKNR